jgi:hypothetical protein
MNQNLQVQPSLQSVTTGALMLETATNSVNCSPWNLMQNLWYTPYVYVVPPSQDQLLALEILKTKGVPASLRTKAIALLSKGLGA